MISGVVDTTVVIHLFRGEKAAVAWLKTQPQLGITPISWMEVIYGARGKLGQQASLKILKGFDIVSLTQEDQEWAMQQLLTYRLSHGVASNDCLIASVCHRLQIPLYTHNVNHMTKILPAQLVVKPYVLT